MNSNGMGLSPIPKGVARPWTSVIFVDTHFTVFRKGKGRQPTNVNLLITTTPQRRVDESGGRWRKGG